MKMSFRGAAQGGLLLSLCACSGSSSSDSGNDDSGAVTGLAAPNQVSVVTANGGGSTQSGGLAAPAVSFDPDSDYMQDMASAHVFDPSMEALEQVNSILCYLSMTAYDKMVNQDTYVAQIDTSLCEEGGSSDSGGSSQGQSSGAQGAAYEYFTVLSTRASNGALQFANIWVPEQGGEGPEGPEGTIYVKIEVERGATPADPLGSFSMSFAGAESYDAIDTPFFFGTINTINTDDAVAYQFFESFGDVEAVPEPGDFAGETRLVVTMDSAMENGVAKINQRYRADFGFGDSGIVESTWRIAFNGTHFKRQKDDGPEVTLSRDDYQEHVWRYFLYHAEGADAGQRVELDSGFPFVTEQGVHGWAGYWGLWVDDDVELTDGETVFREQWGSSAQGEAYTVVAAPGRMIRRERHQLDLDELTGVALQWWDWSSGSEYLVEFDAGAFYAVAERDPDTHEWVEITPILIDPDLYGGFLGFWSESLGGQVNWVDGNDFVTFFEETFVTADDELFAGSTGEVTLYGLVDCLDAELTGSQVEQGDIYLEPIQVVADAYSYVFDADDLGLYYDENGDGSSLLGVGLADGEEPQFGPYTWGMRSGPLVTSLAGITNPWDVWNAEVSYTWETGHNPWNRYTGLIDTNGSAVTFSSPLQFSYTHATESDRNGDSTSSGQTFFLQYHGDGGLHGIPHEPAEVAGAGDEFERWYPRFSIADGVLMGPTATEYVVRGIDMELTLTEDATGSAALDLGGADLLTLPDASVFETPDIGEKPTVDGPPAVLNGKVLSAD